MRFLCQLAVFFLGQLLLCSGLVAQDVQLDFRHFTTDDGLPSSEVYTVLEDQEGYIWVGTDNGVARFDGYSFEVFDSDDGLGDVVVFYLIMDDEGTIWAGTYSGKVYYFEEGRFVEFEHNDKIEAIKEKGEFIHFIDVRPNGELVFRFQRTGIFGVNQEGGTRKISGEDPTRFYVYARKYEEGKRQIAQIRRGYLNNQMTGSDSSFLTEIVIGEGEEWKNVGKISLVPSKITNGRGLRTFLMFSEDKTVFCDETKYTVLSREEAVELFFSEKRSINQLISISDTSAWELLDVGGGLRQVFFRQDFTKFDSELILADVSLSNGVFDKEGGFWLASLDKGLFYSPYPSQQKYRVGQEVKFLSVHLLNEETFYSGLSNGQVSFFRRTKGNSFEVDYSDIEGSAPSRTIFYNRKTNLVYSTAFRFEHGLEFEGGWGARSYRRIIDFDWFDFVFVNEVNYSSFIDSGTLLVSNSNHFGLLDLATDDLKVMNNSMKNIMYGLESFYVNKEGRFFLGTVDGLNEFIPDNNGGSIIKENLGVKELDERVVKIIELNDQSVLFGTRGNGIVHLGNDTTIIQTTNGLASDMVRHLHQADDGAIWVSTLNGLSKVQLEEDTFTVRTFRTENGLIDNEVHMVDTYGDAIYLATSSGVQRFVEPEVNPFSTPPVIRQITVDGENMPMAERLRLKPGNHTLNLSFSTINHKLGSKINYRYRLDDQDDWSYTQQRTVAFPRLNPGEFNFTVQSQNEDGFWSEDSSLIIDIPKRWYNTVYALVGLLFLVGSVIAAIFYIREQRSRKEQSFISQISKLEHEALHARMNPHFVFNCLNSIQNFVLENDTRSAATYLSRFSSLIRQILRSSVDGKHTLREEVQMLEKYLELEKLRFKTAFTYTITVDASLDEDGISLAPLLIQPFVENAILHGMKGRKAGGKISIDFAGNAQLLQVTVTDNGVGINRKLPQKKDSMGMDITLQRLEAMKHAGEQRSGMEITSLYHADGTPAGTKVELAVVPESSRPVIS